MITGFIPPHPIVEDLCNGLWRLHVTLTYDAPDGRGWIIPAGFETDYGSIPTCLDWIPGLDTNGTDADCPFILHDYLYSCHRQGRDKCRDRKDADQILYTALRLCGVGKVRASIIYSGVRLGGWVAWNR